MIGFVTPEALSNVAATLALFAGIAISLGVLAKFAHARKVLSFFWKNLVTKPLLDTDPERPGALTRWGQEVVRNEIKSQLMTTNGGHSFLDRLIRMERRQTHIEAHLGLEPEETPGEQAA